ncbi:uncharacterized protein LOC109605010 [Aethina tumida]|uniref:uncharacterized protein LOC109605010 n=1 Tax=Aethina tumida TaxID=116153 RepID=UPI00096B38EE|nr:uncharacterized protein LOC109605010 [Aethina tumida]
MKPLGVLLVIITIITVANSYRRISCEGDVCSVCRESGCQLSCTGDDCESCPSGGCCNGINCNICVNSSCCQTQKCNYCVRKCNRRCPVNRIKSNSYCNDKCQKACVNYFGKQSSQGAYNVTTVIRLFNYLNNTNIVETPVNVTVINKNNFTIHSDDLANSFNSNFGGNLFGNQTQSKCCYIVHPEVCPESPNICFRRKHAECSYLCTSDHILIREDLTANNTCIPINVYPNYYCGQYITEDCKGCYVCDNGNCLESPLCSASCKQSILPEEYYNIPYQKNV